MKAKTNEKLENNGKPNELDLLREANRRRNNFIFLTAIQLVALIGLLVATIYFFDSNPLKWDLTRNKKFSLSPKTIEILHNLKEPIKAWAFFERGKDWEKAKQLLEEYRRNSKGKFSYEFVDVAKHPEIIQRFNVRYIGEVVLTYRDRDIAGKVVHVNELNEYELTNAIIKLTSGKKYTAYFLRGHQELSPTNLGRNPNSSCSLLKKALEDRGITVKLLDLSSEGKIPKDASMIFILNPRRDLSPQEVELLEEYLANGGKLFLAVDLPSEAMPNILKLLKDLGVKYEDGYLISPLALRQGMYATIAAISEAETEVKGVSNAMIWLALSRVLDIERDRPKGANVTPLLVADGIYKSKEEFMKELKEKTLYLTKKPRTYIVGVKVKLTSQWHPSSLPEKFSPKGGGMAVIVADGEFLNDIYLGPQFSSFLANVDFALGVVELFTKEKSSWKPGPKETPKPVRLTKEQINIIRFLVLLMPLLSLGLGIFIFLVRRREDERAQD